MTSRPDLDELIARAQAGEPRAFEQLVAGHIGQVRRYARALAPREADADDLAQEALLKVHRSLRSFRYQAAFSTWLFAVVRTTFLDLTRGAARRGQERGLEAVDAEAASEDPLADDRLAEAQERELLWAALRQVPVEFRSALVLFDLEGHSYDEVAAIEGIPVGTVRSRLSRGRAQLRRLLEAAEAEEAQRRAGSADPTLSGTDLQPSGTFADGAASHLGRRGS